MSNEATPEEAHEYNWYGEAPKLPELGEKSCVMICTERKMAIIFLSPDTKKTEGDTYNNLRLVQPETIC